MATTLLFPAPSNGPHAKAWLAFTQLVASGPEFKRIFGNRAFYWKGESTGEDTSPPENPDGAWVRMTPRLHPQKPIGMSSAGRVRVIHAPMSVDFEVMCPGTRATDDLNLYQLTIHDRVFPTDPNIRAKVDAAFQAAGIFDYYGEQAPFAAGDSALSMGSIFLDMNILG